MTQGAMVTRVAEAMTSSFCRRIYVLETEPHVQTMLEGELFLGVISIKGFSKYEECLDGLTTHPCDLLIVELDGHAADGISMLRQARRLVPWIRSLAIVEHAAIRGAIKAIRAGADDCLDQPVRQDRLLAAVEAQLGRVDASARRPRALTEMELHILRRILAGQTSCDMAAAFHRSKRTIDVHRKNITRKLQATGLVDLIKRALDLGFGEQPERPPDEPRSQPRNDAAKKVAVGAGPARGA
jgi:DNA-binding NarL/FixJ family response regulator